MVGLQTPCRRRPRLPPRRDGNLTRKFSV